MTAAHLIYIPMVLVVGIFLGFIFGSRAARNAFDLEIQRDKEREAARAAREARKAARAAAAAGAAAAGEGAASSGEQAAD
jgi:hypothetical protein